MLHRYIEKMPRWLVLAARRVMSQYGGDASGIWTDHPNAEELQERFDAFAGIGQKAAMVVEILERTSASLSKIWNEPNLPTTSICAASSCGPGLLTETTLTT